MDSADTKPRFTLGDELTHKELSQVYLRITGRRLPSGRSGSDVARRLAGSLPLRFEFEVNRLRGYAWDAGECDG